MSQIGTRAQDFMLRGTDGNTYLLKDFTDKAGTLIIFTCNHCPYSKAHWPLFIDLHKQFGEDIDFVAVNSNDASAYPEDSFENMKKNAAALNLKFPYLYDETQEVASKYDAKCTPDPFLFKNENGTLKLYYRGKTVDEPMHPEKIKKHYLADAIRALLAGDQPPVEQPSSLGCSIKWKSR